MSTTPVVPTSPTAPVTSTTNGLPSGQSLNNMFLQLLVAQLQNQDPTSPVDPSQFVGQLAQFSELSEVTSIYTLLQSFVPAPAASGSSAGTSPATGAASAAADPITSAVAAAAFPGAAASAVSAAPSTNFASPALSALTSRIQGVF
jgi:flagellar basal-body rod modification protein FlgD